MTVAAVVIEDPLHPFATRVRIRAVRHNCRVFQRDCRLVVKPVRHPALDLLVAGLAVMHRDMVRMVNMIVGAFRPEGVLKLLRRERFANVHS